MPNERAKKTQPAIPRFLFNSVRSFTPSSPLKRLMILTIKYIAITIPMNRKIEDIAFMILDGFVVQPCTLKMLLLYNFWKNPMTSSLVIVPEEFGNWFGNWVGSWPDDIIFAIMKMQTQQNKNQNKNQHELHSYLNSLVSSATLILLPSVLIT